MIRQQDADEEVILWARGRNSDSEGSSEESSDGGKKQKGKGKPKKKVKSKVKEKKVKRKGSKSGDTTSSNQEKSDKSKPVVPARLEKSDKSDVQPVVHAKQEKSRNAGDKSEGALKGSSGNGISEEGSDSPAEITKDDGSHGTATTLSKEEEEDMPLLHGAPGRLALKSEFSHQGVSGQIPNAGNGVHEQERHVLGIQTEGKHSPESRGIQSQQPANGDGVSSAVIGGVVAAIVSLAILFVVLFVCCRKRKAAATADMDSVYSKPSSRYFKSSKRASTTSSRHSIALSGAFRESAPQSPFFAYHPEARMTSGMMSPSVSARTSLAPMKDVKK
ncbi:MAG: hypothetical protein SGCHY_003518 [Lobulomycetales sp.]